MMSTSTAHSRARDMDAAALRTRLAAHGVKAPGHRANSLKGLAALCALDIPFLEIDVQATRDGQLIMMHDAAFRDDHGRTIRFANTSAEDLGSVTVGGEPLSTLAAALSCFKEQGRPGSRLCIDTKTFGHEQQYFEAVRAQGLEDRTIFVSWIPQSLLHLRKIGFPGALILSHWNLLAFGPAGRLAARALGSVNLRVGNTLLIGQARAEPDLSPQRAGCEERLVTAFLPERLAGVLKDSGGGICLRQLFYGQRLARYVAQTGLQLWLYPAATAEEFTAMAGLPQVDVVLCDDAASALSKLKSARD